MERETRRWLIAVATCAGVVGTVLVIALHAGGDSWTAAAAAPVPLACYAVALVAIVRRVLELRGRRRFVLEQRLLTLAANRSGHVHTAEAAMHLRVSVAEARELLEGLVVDGAATVHTAEGSAARVYFVAGVHAPSVYPYQRSRTAQRPGLVVFSAALPETARRRGDTGGRSFGDCRVRPRLRT